MSDASTQAPRQLGERELVTLMALLMSLQAFGIDSMLPALDDIAGELGANGNDQQYVIGAYFLGSGIGAFFPGAFADRFGRRPVLFFGLIAYALLSLACVFVTNFEVMLGIRLMQGIACSGLSIVPTAIIRDRVGGDEMARVMSLVIMVFLAVPILAPGIGQLILMFAEWRAIFGLMVALALVVTIWVWLRLPESLTEENTQDLDIGTILRNMGKSLSNRVSLGYVVGSSLVFGSLFGFLMSSEQLIRVTFSMGDYFALIFGGAVFGMVISSFTNSRIVERFGARRVSHTALLGFLVVSALQVLSASQESQPLWQFVALLALNMTALGFVGANFSSIAMQPFEQIAGAASSAHASLRMITGAVLGSLIGQAFDGTALPLGLAMTASACLALVLVLYSERGKLFRRPGQARRYMLLHDIMRH